MKTALPFLLTSILCAQAASHGSGTLTLGKDVYKFKPESLSASQAAPHQPQAFFCRGKLIPVKGGKTLGISFTLYHPGPLGGLMLGPRTGNGVEWVANMQSKVDVALEGGVATTGKSATFTFSGPLLKTEHGKSESSTWQGQITAIFSTAP